MIRFFTQYFRWLFNCLHGNFGKSYSLNKPVVELLAARVIPTLKLTLMSLIRMLVISVPLGVASALHKDGIIDYICRAVTSWMCHAKLLGRSSSDAAFVCKDSDFPGYRFRR